MRFTDKVAIVTGGASGIGLATAKRFATEGCTVVIADLNKEKADQAADEITRAGSGKVIGAACDVSKEDQVAAAVATATGQFNRLDIVVNNAGLMVFKPITEHTEDDWLKVLHVDLLGAFFFIKHAFGAMKSGGAIVNISSIHAIETTPNVASYAAAKAALVSLTRSAAIEGKPLGIRVNCVLPGAVDTPMLWENPNVKAGLETINMADVGKPEDIAAMIANLAADDARFVQGAAVRVDGGRLDRL
ncbi:MAG TPA: glucose 1-dehydrogenase [Pyrinomonadaceae bacterium]|nr:glucose 1-dehydrogenase [Pyrinomonadaceae bacterium]